MMSGDAVILPTGGVRSPGIISESSLNLAGQKEVQLMRRYALPALVVAGVLYWVWRNR